MYFIVELFCVSYLSLSLSLEFSSIRDDLRHSPVALGKVALKRQQAAEDAIALKMAKVATGQKLDRLPPGKIFGMSVTEPRSTAVDRGDDDAATTVTAKKLDGGSPEDRPKDPPRGSADGALSVRLQNCSVRVRIYVCVCVCTLRGKFRV